MTPIIILTSDDVLLQVKICPMVNRPCLKEGCLAYSKEDFYFKKYPYGGNEYTEHIEIREQCKAMDIWFNRRIEDVKK